MIYGIELLNSTLTGVDTQGRSVVIELGPTYVHETDGRLGESPGRKFRQDASLRISEVSVFPVINDLPASITDSALKIDRTFHNNIVPLPIIYSGPVEFWCTTNAQERLQVKGDGAVLVLRGERQLVEAYGEENGS